MKLVVLTLLAIGLLPFSANADSALLRTEPYLKDIGKFPDWAPGDMTIGKNPNYICAFYGLATWAKDDRLKKPAGFNFPFKVEAPSAEAAVNTLNEVYSKDVFSRTWDRSLQDTIGYTIKEKAYDVECHSLEESVPQS